MENQSTNASKSSTGFPTMEESGKQFSSPQTTTQVPKEEPKDSTQNPPVPPTNTAAVTNEASKPGELASVFTIEKRKSSTIGKFIIPILIIVMIIIWAGVAYIFLGNRKLKDQKAITLTPASVTKSVTETPTFNENFVKIKNGNVVYESSDSNEKILIDKSSYPESGIIGFSKVVVSPDKTKMCFESWPPATTPELLIADVQGQNSQKIGVNYRNCLWSGDSKKLYFLEYLKGNERTDILVKDLSQTGNPTNLTEDTQTTNNRVYQIIGFSADNSKLICAYNLINFDEIKNCEIDLNTNTFTEI